MKRRPFLLTLGAAFATSRHAFADAIEPEIKVSLRDAHKGTLEIDTQLLDSYGKLPENLRQFYFDARQRLSASPNADFADQAIVDAARKHGVDLMGGPMLGDLRHDGVTIWLRPAIESPIEIRIDEKTIQAESTGPGQSVRIKVDGLKPNQRYSYQVTSEDRTLADGQFSTAPLSDVKGDFRIAFGSCCHKIGVHNPNLFRTIVNRQPHAMLMLGDIAVDDRNNQVNMHRADYQLRDVSKPWRDLVSHLPVYAAWDDHDYFDNDLSGIPRKFTPDDRDAVRGVWHQNWNNPLIPSGREGIFFNTRIGPVEVIMLDTRSCRDNSIRNQYGSYLGREQMEWLKQTLRASTAPFKVISSGTMWSDYVSKAKDSWGSWDKQGREEIFRLIEQEKIGGVLLVSGDRHGARGFRIPRPSGFSFYEFEPATLGGVSGPAGLVKNCPEQLFGYGGKDQHGNELVAAGEFTFETATNDPRVTFRLVNQFGDVMEQHSLALSELTPKG